LQVGSDVCLFFRWKLFVGRDGGVL
jgi:hypothetical protein